jgi:hypothetical protein
MTPSVHGGVVNDPVYLNRGTVLKKFVMSERESGPVAVELPGSVMVRRGSERGSRRFVFVPVRDSSKMAARTRMEPSDELNSVEEQVI